MVAIVWSSKRAVRWQPGGRGLPHSGLVLRGPASSPRKVHHHPSQPAAGRGQSLESARWSRASNPRAGDSRPLHSTGPRSGSADPLGDPEGPRHPPHPATPRHEARGAASGRHSRGRIAVAGQGSMGAGPAGLGLRTEGGDLGGGRREFMARRLPRSGRGGRLFSCSRDPCPEHA